MSVFIAAQEDRNGTLKTSCPPFYRTELSFVFPNSLNILYVHAFHAYSLFICLLVHPELLFHLLTVTV